jgi:hypothetical protein
MRDARITLMYELTKGCIFYVEQALGLFKIKTPFPYYTMIEISTEGEYNLKIEKLEAVMNSFYKSITMIEVNTTSAKEIVKLINANVEF